MWGSNKGLSHWHSWSERMIQRKRWHPKAKRVHKGVSRILGAAMGLGFGCLAWYRVDFWFIFKVEDKTSKLKATVNGSCRT